MKHLFHINNHSQFLSSLGVIDLLKIPQDDIVFLYSRYYSISLIEVPFLSFDVSELHNSCLDVIKNRSNRRKTIDLFDDLINCIVKNESFMAYVPHISFPSFQIMATHNKCVGLALLQEGAVPLRKAFENSFSFEEFCLKIYNYVFLHNRRIWKTRKWCIPNFIANRYQIEAFEFNGYFIGLKHVSRRTICWPKLPLNLSIDHTFVFFVFDAYIEMKLVEKEVYMAVLNTLIEKYGRTNNYIKFHPTQSVDNRNYIISLFSNRNMNVEILPMEIPFEIILANYNELDVVGLGTSLLMLANSLGHHVVSYNEMLKSHSHKYKKWCDSNWI